jgi:hypothetical protein
MNHTFEAVELDRAELSAAFQRLFPTSKWPVNGSHHGRRPPYGRSVLIFIGHLLGTAVLYATLFTTAWSLGVLCTRLHSIHPFADGIFKLVSRVELALVYGNTALCACFWLEGAWLFFKETRR